jgi:hypothetical protein
MRSLPAFPLLLLLLGLLLCTGDSWAGSDDDSVDSPSKTQPTETEVQRRARLTQERDTVMSEILALEEGYSDLKSTENADEQVSDSRLNARLTQLQTRLHRLDVELAKDKKRKGSKK